MADAKLVTFPTASCPANLIQPSSSATCFFRRKEPVFYAFDLLWLNGEDLRERPLASEKND